MFTRIRNELMADDDATSRGSVEADETYSWQTAVRRWACASGQVASWWALPWSEATRVRNGRAQGGRARAYPIADVSSANLVGGIRKHVQADSVVYTDTFASYRAMKHEMFDHRQINHTSGSYVVGDIHTNTIEGFWSIVKNGIRGSHRHVSRKWLQGYLNEYVWRYSHRGDIHPMFLSLLDRVPAL